MCKWKVSDYGLSDNAIRALRCRIAHEFRKENLK